MKQPDFLYYLTVLATCLTIITMLAGTLLYVVNRVVIIFRKLDALKGIMVVVITHLDNISAFLVKNHGMCNTSAKELVQSYFDQFNKTERDF